MFKRLGSAFVRWLRSKLVTIVVLIVLAGVLAFVFFSEEQGRKYPGSYSPVKAAAYLESLDFQTGNPSDVSMTYGGDAFVRAAQADGATLWVDPGTGKLAFESDGATLTSNPTSEQLAKETGKGATLANLASPLLFRYQPEGVQADKSANLKDAVVRWRAIANGIGFEYSLSELGFKFYVEYALDRGALVVRIPELGVTETGANALTALDVLPFFGAAQNEGQDGYLFVPDGPGGLIRFNKPQIDNVLPYNFPIYDEDNASPNGDLLLGNQGVRTGIAYPVFGIDRGQDGFISIVEKGATKTNVVASPAGLSTSFNQANARIVLRRFYREVVNANASTSQYEKELIFQPFESRFVPLKGSGSDYVGMAKAYRSYLTDVAGVKPLEGKKGAPPLQLNVLLGTSELNANGNKFVTATTLRQVGDMVGKLKQDGVSAMSVGLEGWQNGGFPGDLPDRFPVNGAVGGNAGMKKLAARLKNEGVPLYLNDALYYARPKFGNRFSATKDAARDISGVSINKGIFTQSGEQSSFYLMNPHKMLSDTLPSAIKGYESLGVSGVNLMGLGGMLYGDFNSDHYADREQSLAIQREMLQKLKGALGSVSTSGFEGLQGGANGGYAYALGVADHLGYFPMDYNYDIVVDEQVPFYPIAVHGLVTYSGMDGNLHANPEADFLRELEYGALPSYLLTDASPAALERTSFYWLYSSQFSVWEKEIADDYKAFSETAGDVWGSFIDGHRKLAEGVYETTYEGGRKVWVNYNDETYSQGGTTVQGMSYAVADKGGTP